MELLRSSLASSEGSDQSILLRPEHFVWYVPFVERLKRKPRAGYDVATRKVWLRNKAVPRVNKFTSKISVEMCGTQQQAFAIRREGSWHNGSQSRPPFCALELLQLASLMG